MPIEVELPDGEIAEFPDEMSPADIKQVLRRKFPAGNKTEITAPDLSGVAESAARQEEQRRNLGAIAGPGLMAPGGPEMDFARALYQEVPGKITEGLHTLMKPLETVFRPAFQTLREATTPTTFGMTGEIPPELQPGETVIRGLEPPAEARGIIPSVRRAAAGMTTPGGLAILPAAGGGGAIARGVQGVFALGAGAAIPGAIQDLSEAQTSAETRGAATDLALSALFAGTMGREVVRPTTRPSTQRTQDAIQPEAKSTVSDVLKSEVAPEGAGQVPAREGSAQAAQALTPASAAIRDINTGEIWHGEPVHGLLHDKIPNIKDRNLEPGFATKDGKFISAEQSEKATGMASGEELFELSADEVRDVFTSRKEVASYDSSLTPEQRAARVKELSEAEKQAIEWKRNQEKAAEARVETTPEIATLESVSAMSPDEYFRNSEQWAKEAMSQEGGINVQVRAELAALRDPDIPKWKKAVEEASEQAAEVRKQAKEDIALAGKPDFKNLMADPEFQKKFSGSAMRHQFFSEGLAVLDGRKTPNQRTLEIVESEKPKGTPNEKAEGVSSPVQSQEVVLGATERVPDVVAEGRAPTTTEAVAWLRNNRTAKEIESQFDAYINRFEGGRKISEQKRGTYFALFAKEEMGKSLRPKAPPVEQPGITTEQVPALGYLPRQSEIAGMGEPSMPPTVESVRAQRRAEAARPEAPEPTMFPVEGENVQMRKSAERATTAPAIPEPVQQRIATAEESLYRQQSMAKVEDAVSTMSDADLVSVPRDSNLYTAAKLEQANRLFKAGKNDEGYNVFVELEKEGTRLGQLINQFKLLKNTRPEEVVRVINKTLEKSGKDPLPKPAEEAAIKTASKSKEADRKLEEATDEWAKNPTPENAAKAEQSLLDANEAGLELQRFVSKYQPRSTSSIIKSVLQGNLLTPISEVANIVGNMAFLPFRAATRGVATGMDVINNYLTKTPRQITVQPVRGTAEALKGFGRGAAQIPDVFLRGTGDVIKGETRAGLHPVKAWINQFAKNPEMPTTGGKLTLKDRLNLAIEGTFGVPAEAMLRGLGAGDVAFKEAAKARATATELLLARVPKDQWTFAQKFPELFLTPEAMQRIQTDTLQAVFQRPSKTLSLFTNWLKGKGEIADLFAATIAPYKLTPWNIIGEILSYNPLIAAARSVNSSRLKNPREARLNAGKFVVGSMVTAAGWWLYKNGLMSPSLDQRDEAQKARVLAGEVMPPNHINLSGLKRKLEGGDPTYKPGDETIDVFRAGGLAGSMFYMTANIGRDFERMPEVADSDVWFAILRQSTLEQARFGMNQSFLSGVEGLLSAVREGNTDNYIRQWGNTVASIPLPNTLTVMSRASREYKPDFREDTFRKQMENIVRNKLGIANLDDYLPLKRGLWGEPMRETPEGRNAIMYHFFDVFKNKQVTTDPVPLELFRLWRKTGDTQVIPSLPEKFLTIGGNSYALDSAQQSRYAELVGKARRRIVDAVVVNPNFHNLPDEAKVKLLDRIYRAGLDQGKGQFWQEFGGTLKPKPERAGFQPASDTRR